MTNIFEKAWLDVRAKHGFAAPSPAPTNLEAEDESEEAEPFKFSYAAVLKAACE
jgi:hypothetical protein